MLGAVERRLAARVARPATHMFGPTGAVALTFDDGPDPDWTPRVLDALAERQAAATFFLVGERAARWPQLVGRMLAEGHAVGSHSLRHEHLLELDDAGLRSAVLDGRDAVEQAAGRPCPLFRPPRGHLDLRTARLLRRHGLRMWMWSIETGDWRPTTTVADVLSAAEPVAAGDVVLMHDAIAGDDALPGAERRVTTLAAIPQLLALVAERGLHARALTW